MIIMSKTHSPTHFNGDIDSIYYPEFNVDINKQMRVPKSIRVNEDYINENSAVTNTSTWNQMSNTMEKLEMHVPERILVVGQEQHVGTKAPPPEIVLENAVMRTEPAIVRVQTPPRILTLDDHYFPAVDEEEVPHVNEIANPVNTRPRTYNTETQIVKHVREPTPSYNALDVSLQPNEEIQHLRRQVGKLNRRVMALELDMLQRQQRDRILYIATIAYFILKTFSWLTRN